MGGRADPDDVDVFLEAGGWLAYDIFCEERRMDVVILGSGVEGLADCELLRSGFVVGSVALLGIDVAFGHRTPGTQMLAIEPFGTIDHLARLLRLSLPSVRLHALATMAAQRLDQCHDGELI